MKSPWQHFYHKFPLILDTLSHKTSVLLRSEVLGLFGNTLTSDHMYSRHYLTELSPTCWNAITSKTENNVWNFYYIFTIYTKSSISWKEISASSLKYFGSFWLRQMWLLECPKVSVLELSSRGKVLTGIKHCWNHHGKTFIIIFH